MEVGLLVDVRRFPGSRRNPQYSGDALVRSLGEHGIDYAHAEALGGFRTPRPDSPNEGWEQPAFRGYAAYMATPEFGPALHRLERVAAERPASIMCAEAQWWRCHRRLIADALTVRGWRVLHLGLGSEPIEHRLTEFALVGDDDSLTYPPAQLQVDLTGGGAPA